MQFEHKGKTYEVNAMTVLQADIIEGYFEQFGKILQAHLGLNNRQEIPTSLDMLAVKFIQWNLCTKIDGKAMDVMLIHSATPLFEFIDTISNDEALYILWRDAYEEANKLKRDPATEKNAIAPEVVLET